MFELYEKIQDKEWELINKADEKSDILGMLTAAALGTVEGLVIALTEIAVVKVIVKVVTVIRGRR